MHSATMWSHFSHIRKNIDRIALLSILTPVFIRWTLFRITVTVTIFNHNRFSRAHDEGK